MITKPLPAAPALTEEDWNDDFEYELTEDDRRAIAAGEEDLRAGRVYTQEQVDAWLAERIKELKARSG
jgi:predicted transcriptional regulator